VGESCVREVGDVGDVPNAGEAFETGEPGAVDEGLASKLLF
jgi:hypothetical protein